MIEMSRLTPPPSIGCGIGYGYLHRIPTLPFSEGKKISFPAPTASGAAAPPKDGFTEVRLRGDVYCCDPTASGTQ